MSKWLGWIAYLLWGFFCFLIFLHLVFPYEVVGRRILQRLERETGVLTQSSDVNARFLGIHWDRVEVSSTGKTFPPIEIRNWVIRLYPLSLLGGRISLRSHGNVIGGTFHTRLLMEREGQRGFGEWRGLQIDGLPLSFVRGTSVGGVMDGRVMWQFVDRRLDGEASFEVRNGRIQNITWAGLTIPRLNLGRITAQMSWKGDRIDVKEISTDGGDLTATLTGSLSLQNPLEKSEVTGRLEIALTRGLLERYPVMRALYMNGKGQSKPLVMTIRGTLNAPEVSLSS